jgi:hypothetical protein
MHTLIITAFIAFLIGCYLWLTFLLEEIYTLWSEIDKLKKELKYLKKGNARSVL